MRHDRYNAKALVNMGNCLMDRSELERAKELYLEAIGVEADCVEAIFNLGLVNKQLGVITEALQVGRGCADLGDRWPKCPPPLCRLSRSCTRSCQRRPRSSTRSPTCTR